MKTGNYNVNMKFRFPLLIAAILIINPVLSQWTDITSTIGGFSASTNMSRPYVFDVNNDNYPDILVPVLTTVTSPYTKYWRLYKNNINSTYTDVTSTYGLPTNLSNAQIGFIDYNGDTFKDFYVYTTTGLQVYRNNNGNSFTDVSASLGITANFFTATEKTSPMRVFDYDLDGDEDILYTRTVTGVNTLTAIVNNGTTFSTKVNILSSIPGATTGGINFSFFDMDNDGDFDIVFDAYTGTSQYSNGVISLFRKDNTVYTNTTTTSGLVNGLPAEISTIDINQDGNLDIVKGGADCCGTSLYKVFIGNGLGAFTDQTGSYTISNGGYKGSATLSDFDNDKDFDFSWTTFTATGASPFRLYANNNNVFTETAGTYGLNLGVTSGGVPIDDFGNGVWLDIDKDGDLDIVLNREGINSTSITGNVWVKRNPLQGNYLNIRLNGCGVNKSGVGAKIKVVAGTSTKWLYYGNSTDGNASNGTDIFHFGLGASTIANSVTVYWPNNTTTVLNNVSGNQFLTIGGGAGGASAPTGSASQTYCSGATVANLTATGSNIQWYATSTAGTALALNTELVNGTTYYASQTNGGCQSATRLAVTVTLNYQTLSASATAICSGTDVTLTANNNAPTTSIQTQVNNLINSGLWSLEATYNGHYYLKYQTSMTWPSANMLCEQNGGYMFCVNSQLENDNVAVPIANSIAYGDFLIGLFQDLTDINYSEPSGGWKWVDGSPATYTHWASIATGGGLNEPNGSVSGGENFGIMDYNNVGSYWNDTYNNTNGTVIMEISGSTSYLWSTGETTQTINVAPNSTTTYTCAVTTNGVTCTQTVTINVNPSQVATITPASAVTFCQGGSVVLNANIGIGSSYQWYNNASPISGGTTSSYTANASGTYSLLVTNSNGCSNQSDSIIVTVISTIISQPTDEFAIIGGSAQFNCTGSAGASYQWQAFNNGQWINLFNAGQYSGVNTSSLNVSNVNSNNYDQWFRCLVTSSQSLLCQEYTDSVAIYGCSVFQENFQIATSEDSICFGNGFSAELVGLNDSTSFFNNNLLYVPDDQTQCFSSSILVSGFSNSETIQSASDIESLAINFEHSYMGDLVITYICPNGQSLIVHQQGGAVTHLGEPVDILGPTDPTGVGYDYFWSPTATAGTWQAYISSNPNDTILPNGTYNSVEPFSNLIGCPVNGLWTIEFCDLWASDDGWLFNWGVNFNSVVSTATSDSIIWQGNDLVWDDGNGNALFYPNQYGSNEYSVSAILSNGCVLTDSITIQAVGPNIILTPEINACSLPITLNASVEGGNNNAFSWSYINDPTVLSQTDLLTPTILSQPSYNIYELIVSSDYSGGLQCSDTATVSVNLIEATILQQPNSVDANIGDVVYFSCLGSVGLSYQWQILVNGIWTNLNDTGQFNGVTTSQMSVSNVNVGNGNQQFQCVVTSPDGACTEYSNSVTLYICDIASSSIPAVLNIALNTSPNISISPVNNNASYQWQSNIGFGWVNTSDGADYSGSTTANLTLINSDWLNDNQWLQCVVTSDICSDTTNICVVHITPTGIDETELGSIYYYEDAMRFSQPSNAMGENYYVFDGNGRLITEGKYFGENYIELNLQASGVYCFRLKDKIIKFIKI